MKNIHMDETPVSPKCKFAKMSSIFKGLSKKTNIGCHKGNEKNYLL